MSDDERHAALRRAIAHFNEPATHERYFDLYHEGVVLQRLFEEGS